ncbi:hypothetical protein PQE75_gp206 [Bacillus phage vB_BcoS-136]|uniref:Uncharacterized protein n=1 Tax=Bacillus phage vB_BcoS-136 TaxID=2419619 RepID=A0A3G3BVK2_9CAUD|nr:hypothetical protein PQE75_gp206 [Bacillus phage vB_BcoS-136]AYP68273.1 hypothetical protein vBBcoS136_00159 [Bacillus phage vB_BcoS-136]
MKINIYQYGDTVRLSCLFRNFDGEKVSPSLVKVIIYNSKYEIIKQEILGLSNMFDVGEYFYDYTTENKEQKLYYEWYAEIDGTPSLKRGQFITKFI